MQIIGFILQIWCRLVTASFNYFHSTNFFWMFGEGCYLHTAIVLTYSTDKLRKWMFICIGWCKQPYCFYVELSALKNTSTVIS